MFHPAFYANLTCLENLKLHANYIDVHYDDLEKYLSLVNLEDAKNKKFKNLSMGMKQRLGISKTLVGNSDIVLLDEPTNGLDPMGIMDIRNIILNEVKSKHRITIVSSHILKELTEFTDIYLFIKNDNSYLINLHIRSLLIFLEPHLFLKLKRKK